jgi:integrase
MNAAVDAELLERNPFRGCGRRARGRADQAPPTEAEFDLLLAGCAALGDYAPQMRALLVFAAYSGVRPGELFALEWTDVDFDTMRVDVRRRLYRGRVDLPKSNKVRRIALTPPARDALLGLPSRREGGLVFRSKTGRRLAQPTLSGYWGLVQARGGVAFDFYLSTKHRCALHARRPWAAAAGDRGADGVAAGRRVEAPRDLRPRGRGGVGGDRQGVPVHGDAAAGGQLRRKRDAIRGLIGFSVPI